jgi:murein DD-endopeptidase MepM/ murein hydrolase activator NlpD
MRASRAFAGIAAVLTAAVVAGSTGAVNANALPIPVPLPTLNAPLPLPLPVPTTNTPVLPLPTVPAPSLPPPPGGVPIPTTPGSGPLQPGGSGGGPSGKPPAQNGGSKKFITTRPMIAGSPGAENALDDETTPAMFRAQQQFLAADQGIAKIVGYQEALLRAVENAHRVIDEYEVSAKEAAASRGQASALHDRETAAARQVGGYARSAYRSGGLGVTDSAAATNWNAIASQLAESAARADVRARGVDGQLADLRQDYEGYALDYYRALQALTDYRKKLARLAAMRAAALAAARAASAGDLKLTEVRVLESGRLGAQIRALSARLRAEGKTVNGTGTFIRPGHGPITSPFGMRYHPILHYTKLHTGTDFGHDDNVIQAADGGVVIMTVANRAYGNMTVIDHGTIDGRHITTFYAHQSRFLVKEGQRVKKGDVIGVIGSTGYATGPHLHFEVRDDGAVEDPAPWLPKKGS